MDPKEDPKVGTAVSATNPISDGERVSVFNRLSSAGGDQRLQFTPAEKSSFASIIGGGVSNSLQFFPLDSKASKVVKIPLEMAKLAAKTYHTTLYGYFLGPRLPFQFNDEGGCTQAIEQGPLFIRGAPFFAAVWDPLKGLSKPTHTSCPLWVKLHNIPLTAFNVEGIGRIASAIGVPKQMDSATASMCDKAWGRPGFAKVLIDTWAVGDLKREIEVVVPSLDGGSDARVKVTVEYLWEPVQCNHCMVFGHKRSGCTKAAVETPKGKATETDVDGFTKVVKKKWIPKSRMDGASTSVNTSTTFDILQETDGGSDEGNKHSVDEGSSGGHELPSGTSPLLDVEVAVGPGPSEPVLEQVMEFEPLVPKPSVLKPEVALKPPEQFVKPVGEKPKDKEPQKECKSERPRKVMVNGIVRCTLREQRKLKRSVGVWIALPNLVIMFNIASWNIRGLNAPDKQQEVRSFVRNNGVHICAILETHVRVESLRGICERTFGRWDWISNQAHSEFGTRILIAWDVTVADVMILESHAQFIHCEVRIRGLSQGFFVSFVYGANRGNERRFLWSGLRKFKAIMGAKPWVIAGDFNCLLFPHDALGGISKRNPDMTDFATCLEDIDTFDVRFQGIHHTWCQKPKEEAGLKRKLDRILANVEFTNLFEDATARFLPRGLSDHSPGILGFTGGQRERRFGFKFDNFLVHDPLFLVTVHRAWNVDIAGNFMFRVTSKLKALKAPLRRLRSAYGNLSSRATSLKGELDVAQLAADFDPDNVDARENVKRIRADYQKACWVDISAARQRAKVKWLTEGDANTRYFHKAVEEKRHAQHIHAICRADGTYVYDDEVVNAFLDHFISIIGTEDPLVSPEMYLDMFTTRLVLGDALHMVRPIEDKEIRDAIFDIGNEKAPGSDGFSSKFYKAAWEVVGSDVLCAIHSFFYRSRLPRELNHTLLCLLPKSPGASMVSDFRPIACCSVLYKCISKVIVERMKPYLDMLVSKTQSAFIPGRRIVDNILMAHELVRGYHLQNGPPRCAFKIDLRKAYDMVSWPYLFSMLRGLGFHPALIKWIVEMVSTPSFSIVINGESRGHFLGKRGIRQGCPLSPYLFTIVMEGFSMIFKQCIEEAGNFGFHHGCQDFGITHLCFADDLFVFTRGDVASVEVLKKTLSLFASRSGLSPNLQKSDIFFGNVADDEKAAIIQCLPFRSGSFPIRYLGVPLSPVVLRAADYGVLVTKVKNRLANWKSKFLSFGGRKQLIVSVLQSLQLYWMAIFLLPSGVVHELESLFRDFLWSQGDSSKGKCKVAWAQVCRPKECGGLGFRKLSVWNRALITKNLWTIVSHHDCLWGNWIRRYSLRHSNFWSARKSSRWSWLLNRMMSIRPEMRRHVRVRIGNGQTTNAWEDCWLDCGPLAMQIPYRFVHNMAFDVDTTVKQLLDTFHDGWPDAWRSRFPVLIQTDLPTLNQEVQDSMRWHGTTDEDLTVQGVYRAYDGEHPTVLWTKAVWFKGHIPKHSFCLWLACLRRLPTQDRIMEWKHEPPDLRCSLCGLEMDSHNHLFFECTFSRQVWLQVMEKCQWIDFPCSWNAIIDALSDGATRPKQLAHLLTLASAVYHIWCERNRRLFEGNAKPIPQLVHNIYTGVLDRMVWKQRKQQPISTMCKRDWCWF
ncbi:hypothetical protein OSB04_un000292, partial [Centaurea solstitialis]